MKSLLLGVIALTSVACMDGYESSLCSDNYKQTGLSGTYKASFMGEEMQMEIGEKENQYTIKVVDEDKAEASDFRVCEINSNLYFEFFEKDKAGFSAAISQIDLARGLIQMDFLKFNREVLKRNNILFEVISSDWNTHLFVKNTESTNSIMLESAESELALYLIKENME